MLEGPKYQHDDSLGPCAFIHDTSSLFPPTYDMRWLIGGKFCRVAAKISDLEGI